jgi:hypothetical protein
LDSLTIDWNNGILGLEDWESGVFDFNEVEVKVKEKNFS